MSQVTHTLESLQNLTLQRLTDAPQVLRDKANQWFVVLVQCSKDRVAGRMSEDTYRLKLEQAEATMELAAANELVETEKALLDGLFDAALKIAVAAI
jgi:hypothetical protein